MKEKSPLKSKKPLLISISTKEKIFLTRHLSVLLRAGIPVKEGLGALREQTNSSAIQHILDTAVKDISEGHPLAYSLKKFPKVFDLFFTNVIEVGETSGTLPDSLEYLSKQLEKMLEIKTKVRSALLYPIIIFVGAGGVGIYLAFFILPQLLPLFTSLNTELPATTRLLLWVTNTLYLYWPYILGGLAALLILLVLLWRIEKIRLFIHHASLRLPIFGKLIRQIQGAQFTLILGTLLHSGVKVVEALRITAHSIKNLAYQKFLNEVAVQVDRGESIGSQLKKNKRMFPITTTSMIEVGESTGKLSESLIALSAFSEKEVDRAMKDLSSLIEPVVLILMGLLVGFIALSIITPIYQLSQSVNP